jgi:hypothetical protein
MEDDHNKNNATKNKLKIKTIIFLKIEDDLILFLKEGNLKFLKIE